MDKIELPHGWKVVKLGEICIKRKTRNPSKKPDKIFTYIDVSSICNNSFRITETKNILGKDAPSRARQIIYKNDVIFATVRPTLKRVALIPLELDDQICSTGFCVLRSNPEYLDYSYLYFYLLTTKINQKVESLQKGATYPAINDSDLFEQEIYLPPLPEQKSIAYTLRTIQKAKETRQRELELERERKAALMEYLFTHGTRNEARKQTEIGEIPESWEVVKLGDICTISTGTTPSTNQPEYYKGNIPFIKTGQIVNNKIYESDIYISQQALVDYSLKIYPPKTILMAMYGQGKTRGQVALLEIGATTTQNTAAIVPNNKIDSEFLWQYLMNEYENLRNAGHQGQISHLNLGLVKQYKIALPSPEENLCIADILKSCDTKIQALEKEISLTDELFHATLEKLMTGKLSTKNLIAQ